MIRLLIVQPGTKENVKEKLFFSQLKFACTVQYCISGS